MRGAILFLPTFHHCQATSSPEWALSATHNDVINCPPSDEIKDILETLFLHFFGACSLRFRSSRPKLYIFLQIFFFVLRVFIDFFIGDLF
jgi:hypothetical protein